MLTAFGPAFTPAPTQLRTAVEIKLAALATRRLQLLELRLAVEARAAACADPALRKLFTSWLPQMEKQISKVEALIEELLAEQTVLAGPVQRLDDITGVMVLATLPELGPLNRRQRPPRWPASARITATAGNGRGSVASAAVGPKCGARSTWPRCRPVAAIICSSRFTTGSLPQANPAKSR